MALVRAPARFNPERGTMKTFLLSIARHLVLKHYRDRGEWDQLEDDDAAMPAFDPRASIDTGAAVSAAVAELPSLQREALVLFQYEGVTLEELASIVGADVGTVKSRLHRARVRLRKVLAPYGARVHGRA